MPISAQEAVDAVRGKHVDLAGARYVARPVPNTTLMAVFVSADDGSPLVGAGWFVGVDAQVWTLSSNRGIHEYDVCLQVIRDLYDQGIAAAVDPAVLADRLRVLTQQRLLLVREVVAEARAGQLRQPHLRDLP